MSIFKELVVLLESSDEENTLKSLGIKSSIDVIRGVAMVDLLEICSFYDNLEEGTNIALKNGDTYTIDKPYKEFKKLMKDNGMLRYLYRH